ncbi:hypothetical protein LIER_01637 [Lithospermum erythrorhizon]|uniref:Uncharacterized protein n=1 Tax=Lithospermum erythrorhizon TaxID=34254 RepID=A0AAV3NP23_LITER
MEEEEDWRSPFALFILTGELPNDEVEVMNRTIFPGIKKNLLESGPKCYEELDRVLWSYRTTPSSATGETPFSLVYDTETVLPLEVCLPNIRQIGFEEDQNNTRMRELLDFGDEERDRAIAKMQKYKQTMTKFYNRRKVVGPGTYILEELSGKNIEHAWHGIYLKKYFV